MTRGDEIGKRYLELRSKEGKSSTEACQIITEEFGADIDPVTVRSYAAKYRQLEPGYQPRRRQPRVATMETYRAVFRIIPNLLDEFEKECNEKRMSHDQLMNLILFTRYGK